MEYLIAEQPFPSPLSCEAEPSSACGLNAYLEQQLYPRVDAVAS